MELRAQIIKALESIEPDRDELAYFALTSKPEFQVRDRLAYWLHQSLPKFDPEIRVVREWKRVDLAILREGQPIALLEAKALTTYNALLEPHRQRYQSAVRRDLETAAARAEGESSPNAEIFALVMVTYVDGEITEDLRDVVKYSRLITKHRSRTNAEQIDEVMGNFLPELESPIRVSLGKGTAFDLDVEVISWLYGPVRGMSDSAPDVRLSKQ